MMHTRTIGKAVPASAAIFITFALASAARAQWTTYAGNAQHTGLSSVTAQPLGFIKWQTPVDLQPVYSGNDLLAHYGSPLITADNTVIVPVKTGTGGNSFEINAYSGADGSLMWTQSTDYSVAPQGSPWPNYSWVPSYAPTLAPGGTLYYAGAGGTIYSRSSLDATGTVTPMQQSFYGISNYTQSPDATAFFDANVVISTPITADAQGNIYFGYETTGAALPGVNNGQPIGSGIARISASGVGSFFPAQNLTVGGSPAGLTQVAMNSAPALSHDGSTVYVTMSSGDNGFGRIVALNSSTLQPLTSAPLLNPQTGGNALMANDSTASPMIGPDGDVYIGVVDSTSRGWMEHFSADLSVAKPTGGFGWDDTPSVIPASMVPSYHGTSSYLIMVKYNNYVETGGDGVNMLAILDPNDTQTDTRFNSTGATIMKQILTIVGPTPDPEFLASFPDAVREWCINTAAVDPSTDSVIVGNEDGKLYRWNLSTNTLSQVITLTPGIGEAYTPTLIGPDGTVYGINNGTLFAVGTKQFAAQWNATSGAWSNAAAWSTSPQFPNNNTPLGALYDVTLSTGNITLDTHVTLRSLALAKTGGAYTSQLDLNNHALIIENDSSSKTATIAALNDAISAGSANATWTGNGITSSAAAGDPNHYAVGVFDNGLLGLTSFAGQPVDADSVLVSLAHLGDANDDGIVDLQDLSIVTNNWQQNRDNWAAGDLNRDGVVDLGDLSIVTNNWQQTSSLSLAPAGQAFAAVPEPATLALLIPAFLLFKSRRRG